MPSSNFQIQQDIPWTKPDVKIQRQVYGYDEKIMMVKVAFERGGIGAVHKHHHAQVTYVESGLFELNIGGEVRILQKGDGFYVPPDTLHGCVCIESGMLIDCFTPQRQDFL
jgi:quercetin dioxygenase-like cupin family protein